MHAAQKIKVYQYDGTNGLDIAAVFGDVRDFYEDDDGNLILVSYWNTIRTVTPTDYCCGPQIYPTLEALQVDYYLLPEVPE